MPALNSWVVVTVRVPIWAVILIGSVLIGIIVLVIYAIKRKPRWIKSLQNRLQNQQDYSLTEAQQAHLQFTYNIAHDISNPLQSIQSNLERMEKCAPEETGSRKQYYEMITQAIKRLFTLTENLRILFRLERVDKPVEREPVNLRILIDDVMMEQYERAKNKKITFKYVGPEQPAKLLASRGDLYQVIYNLVDNSIKYSKEPGGEIVFILVEENDIMHISVSDNGVGIPKEDQPYVFDTAYRSPSTISRSRTGSGLGLAIVKRIIEQHEGRVKIDSTFGKGTEVTIDLPIYKPSTG
jgi:signal transduction histidine kinase